MLVLALQFSKGIAGVRDRATCTLTEGAVAAERELVPGEKGDPRGPTPSKRKRRQDRLTRNRVEDESYDTQNQTDKPTNAPTGNWFEPDETNAHHRLNSAP